MVVLASTHNGSNELTVMVDKVQLLDKDRVEDVKSVLRTLHFCSLRYKVDNRVASTTCWDTDRTPFHAKKARRLGLSPTDIPMDPKA